MSAILDASYQQHVVLQAWKRPRLFPCEHSGLGQGLSKALATRNSLRQSQCITIRSVLKHLVMRHERPLITFLAYMLLHAAADAHAAPHAYTTQP